MKDLSREGHCQDQAYHSNSRETELLMKEVGLELSHGREKLGRMCNEDEGRGSEDFWATGKRVVLATELQNTDKHLPWMNFS